MIDRLMFDHLATVAGTLLAAALGLMFVQLREGIRRVRELLEQLEWRSRLTRGSERYPYPGPGRAAELERWNRLPLPRPDARTVVLSGAAWFESWKPEQSASRDQP